MCKMSISVKDSYVTLNVRKKTIKYLVSPVLNRYTSVAKFDKENGVLSLVGEMKLRDGTVVSDEDWIDLNDVLGFAFKNPQKTIKEIDTVQLI